MPSDKPWFAVDQDYYDNPKIHQAGWAGELLWVRALAWATRNRTDGFVSSLAAHRLSVGLPFGVIDRLVAAGLWDVVDGGWQIHDYLDHQTAAEVIHRQAVEKGRKRAKHGKRGPSGQFTKAQVAPDVAPAEHQPNQLEVRSKKLEVTTSAPSAHAGGEKDRDLVFEAIAIACGYNLKSLTKTERGRVNRATAELRAWVLGSCPIDVFALPGEITARAARWPKLYPNIRLTPQALTAHWSALQSQQTRSVHTQTDEDREASHRRAMELAGLEE